MKPENTEKKSFYRVVARNKKAFHDYHILERLEAGVVLTGTEVKSVRLGRVNLKDCYARFERNELWLIGMHISPYEKGSFWNHADRRPRKLLLHKRELSRLRTKVEQKGQTLVPLDLYFRNHLVKVTLALVQGKREFDKRHAIQKKEEDRKIAQIMKEKLRSVR